MSGYLFYWIDENSVEYAINDQVNILLRYGKVGFGNTRAKAETRRVPYTDGAEKVGRIYDAARHLGLPLMAKAASDSALAAYMRSFRARFSPYKGSGGTSYLKILTPDGKDLRIGCWVTQISDLEMDGPVFGRFTMEFEAESAYFFDATQESKSLAIPASDGWGVPMSVPVSLASTDVDGYVTVANDGDVESWPVIRITGAVDNPTITNDTTGEAIAITQAMDPDDYIEINMEDATITFYDDSTSTTTDIIDNMSDSSVFWALERGNNTLHIEADSAANGTLLITFYEWYRSA